MNYSVQSSNNTLNNNPTYNEFNNNYYQNTYQYYGNDNYYDSTNSKSYYFANNCNYNDYPNNYNYNFVNTTSATTSTSTSTAKNEYEQGSSFYNLNTNTQLNDYKFKNDTYSNCFYNSNVDWSTPISTNSTNETSPIVSQQQQQQLLTPASSTISSTATKSSTNMNVSGQYYNETAHNQFYIDTNAYNPLQYDQNSYPTNTMSTAATTTTTVVTTCTSSTPTTSATLMARKISTSDANNSSCDLLNTSNDYMNWHYNNNTASLVYNKQTSQSNLLEDKELSVQQFTNYTKSSDLSVYDYSSTAAYNFDQSNSSNNLSYQYSTFNDLSGHEQQQHSNTSLQDKKIFQTPEFKKSSKSSKDFKMAYLDTKVAPVSKYDFDNITAQKTKTSSKDFPHIKKEKTIDFTTTCQYDNFYSKTYKKSKDSTTKSSKDKLKIKKIKKHKKYSYLNTTTTPIVNNINYNSNYNSKIPFTNTININSNSSILNAEFPKHKSYYEFKLENGELIKTKQILLLNNLKKIIINEKNLVKDLYTSYVSLDTTKLTQTELELKYENFKTILQTYLSNLTKLLIKCIINTINIDNDMHQIENGHDLINENNNEFFNEIDSNIMNCINTTNIKMLLFAYSYLVENIDAHLVNIPENDYDTQFKGFKYSLQRIYANVGDPMMMGIPVTRQNELNNFYNQHQLNMDDKRFMELYPTSQLISDENNKGFYNDQNICYQVGSSSSQLSSLSSCSINEVKMLHFVLLLFMKLKYYDYDSSCSVRCSFSIKSIFSSILKTPSADAMASTKEISKLIQVACVEVMIKLIDQFCLDKLIERRILLHASDME